VPPEIGAVISWLCPSAENTPALYTRTVIVDFAVSMARGWALAGPQQAQHAAHTASAPIALALISFSLGRLGRLLYSCHTFGESL
jgi:hypothetical protein